MKTHRVTVNLPEDLHRKLKSISARQDESISSLLARTLRQIVEDEDAYRAAQQAMMRDVRQGWDLQTGGSIDWTRDSLHER